MMTESFISDVEIAKIFIFSSDKALNILKVTPGVETIPAPTIETFATLSFSRMSLYLILLLLTLSF